MTNFRPSIIGLGAATALATAMLGAAVVPAQAQPQVGPLHHEDPVDAEQALDWNNYEKITLSRSVGEPIDMAVMPDSRVLHTARNGDIRLTDPGTGVTQIIATIDVYANSEDGLQTIALDPDFEQNGWVYLFFAPRVMEAPYPETTPAGSAPNTLPPGETEAYWDQWKGYNLLARYQWDEQNDTLDLASRQDIITVETQRGQCCHVAGDIAFDAAGNLYLSTGDNTPAGTPGANGYAPNNDAPGMNPGFDARRGAGNTNDLRGKILRITVQDDGSYTVPEGNLFPAGTADTRPEIYVMGVRNPFRIDYDVESGALVWADYGPDAGQPNPDRGPMGFVEWQTTTSPINGGWPYCHGPNANYNEWDFAAATPGPWFDCEAGALNNSRWNTGLPQVPPATAPQLYYGDDADDQPWPELTEFGPARGQGPMGGPVYRYDHDTTSPSKLPEFWNGKSFFGEFSQDYAAVFESDLATDGEVTSIVNFLPNAHLNSVVQPPWDSPMDLEFGPDGSLYVLDYGDGFFRENPDAGLYRVDWALGNKTPQPHIHADPVSSSGAPLTVTFDGSASRDPEGAALTYHWDFDGDGTWDATGPQATHTYTELGRYDARLRVTDPSGKFGLTSTSISVGNVAPTVTLSVSDGAFFDWGDGVPVTVTVTDPEDGNTPDCERVEWAFGLGHDEHAHPITSGDGCTFVIPTPVDAPEHGETENIYGVLVVGYEDNGHLGVPPARGEASIILNPKTQQAEWADEVSGVEIVDNPDANGLRHVTSFDAGDWLAYDPVNLGGIDSVVFRASGTGTLAFRWGTADAEPFATAEFTGSTGWQEVETLLTDPPTGTGRLYVTSTGGLDVDEFRFIGDGVADVTPPTVEAVLDPAEPDGDNGWYTDDVEVTIVATDENGIDSTEISTDGGATWDDDGDPVTVSAEGVTTVLYRATDVAGNVSEIGSVDIMIDRTAPTLTVTGIEDGAEYPASQSVDLGIEATDATSGVATVEATINGEPVEAGPIDLWTLPVGANELVVTATDIAGHVTTFTATFTVTTSIADLQAILDGYIESGAVDRPSAAVLLRQRLSDAAEYADSGEVDQAVAALRSFARLAGDSRYVADADARAVLVHHTGAVIDQVTG